MGRLYDGTEIYISNPDGTKHTINTYEALAEYLKRYSSIELILLEAALNSKLLDFEVKYEHKYERRLY